MNEFEIKLLSVKTISELYTFVESNGGIVYMLSLTKRMPMDDCKSKGLREGFGGINLLQCYISYNNHTYICRGSNGTQDKIQFFDIQSR